LSIDESQNAVVALDAKGLCDILRVCAKSNVLSFEYGNLKVRFDSDLPTENTTYPIRNVGQAHPTNPPGQEDSQQEQELENEQDELDQMLIEDPLAYELKVLSGELEPGVQSGH
jgi:hypothetical protein